MSRYIYQPGDADMVQGGSLGPVSILLTALFFVSWFYFARFFYSGGGSAWAHRNPWPAIWIVMFYPILPVAVAWLIMG